MATKSTTARDFIGDVNPGLADVTDRVLFDEIWERPQLSPRDRSLVTVACLVAGYRTNELRGHISRALDNGVTEEELYEMFTHLAFYAGWPNGMTATRIARDVIAAHKERTS